MCNEVRVIRREFQSPKEQLRVFLSSLELIAAMQMGMGEDYERAETIVETPRGVDAVGVKGQWKVLLQNKLWMTIGGKHHDPHAGDYLMMYGYDHYNLTIYYWTTRLLVVNKDKQNDFTKTSQPSGIGIPPAQIGRRSGDPSASN
jgi:hypothetical protein